MQNVRNLMFQVMKCVCVRECVYMHAFICMCVQVCARVLNITRVFAGVSVEEAGAGEWGEKMWEWDYFTLIVILYVPSWAHVSKEIFILMLCILMNNKDLI